MTGLYDQLLRKQRAEKEAKKAKERTARRHARQGKEPQSEKEPIATGLDDLPDDIAFARAAQPIHAPAAPTPKPEPAPPDSVESLVHLMAAIRERIWRLRAVFATTLSQDCAIEADRYLKLFQDLAAQLKSKAPDELDKLVHGHESLLESRPVLVKPTIPLETQQWCELLAELQRRREPRKDKPCDYVGDGLQPFL